MPKISLQVGSLVSVFILAMSLLTHFAETQQSHQLKHASAAYRDGWQLGNKAARYGNKPHVLVGRWATETDRGLFAAGYFHGYIKDGMAVAPVTWKPDAADQKDLRTVNWPARRIVSAQGHFQFKAGLNTGRLSTKTGRLIAQTNPKPDTCKGSLSVISIHITGLKRRSTGLPAMDAVVQLNDLDHFEPEQEGSRFTTCLAVHLAATLA